jgi:hypothetical protein
VLAPSLRRWPEADFRDFPALTFRPSPVARRGYHALTSWSDADTRVGDEATIIWSEDGERAYSVQVYCGDVGWVGSFERKTLSGAKKAAIRMMTGCWWPRDFSWNPDRDLA